MLAEPKCYIRDCKNFIGISQVGAENTEKSICKAFPDGIPDRIAYGNDKHLVVVEDQDNNIIFEKE